MQKLILLFGLLLSCSAAYADPWDCMSKEEAEALVAWLKKNPFIIDYCDCCNDSELEEHGESNVRATLMYVSGLKIVPCEYDNERVSVKAKYFLLSESIVDKKGEIKHTDHDNPRFDDPNFLITLNYHFVTLDNTNMRLFEALRWIDKYEPVNCSGLVGFPDPAVYGTSSIGKKYQKWATKMGNYWQN